MVVEKDNLYVGTILVIFWIRCTFNFICEEIIPPLQSLTSALFLLVDFIYILIGLISIHKKRDYLFLLSFLIIGYYITCIHNGYSIIFYVNGLRDFIYIIFLIPIFRYIYDSETRYRLFKNKFDKTLYAFLIVQAFCLIWQFVKYGANDHGGGSLGNWHSGIITSMIYLISFYLMKQRLNPESYFKSLFQNKELILLLIPTFLNETKISFIFLPCYFLLLMPINKQFIVRMSIMIPVLISGLYLAYEMYISATGTKDEITTLKYYTDMYLMAGENTEESINWAEYLYETEADVLDDIPRFTKFLLIPEMNKTYPGHDFWGYGIGQFKGGTTIESSQFYKDNEWILRGSVPYSFHIFIQMGWICIAIFICFLINLFSFKAKDASIDKGTILYVIMLISLVLLYNDSLRDTYFCFTLFYVLFQSLQGKIRETNPPHLIS